MKLKLLHETNWLYRCRKIKGFAALLALIFTFSTNLVFSQVTIQTVDFETDGAGYTADPSDYYEGGSTFASTGDYWARIDGVYTEGGVEVGFSPEIADNESWQGTWFWAGEDTDNTPCNLTLNQASISGYTDLQVKFLAATRDLNGIEAIDYLKVEYSIDGGDYSILVQFIGDDGTAGSSWYHEDVNGDDIIDVGGATLSQTFTEYTYNVPTTGTTLQLRFSAYNGSGEDLAFDNIRVLGTSAGNSAPTAASFTASSIYQNTAYAFATANFGYSDSDGDPLDHIRVTAVPGTGTLWIDADADGIIDGTENTITNGETITKVELDAGKFKYINTSGSSSSFTFDVNDGTDYSASPYTATLTVTPEPTVTLSLDPSSSISENGGTTNVKATLSHTFNKTVTVNLAFTGTASGSEYSVTASSISITSENTNNTVAITGIDDVLDENNETVIVDISSVTNGSESGTQQVTCTLTDDDPSPTVAFNSISSSGLESVSSADLQVDLSAVSGLNVSVDYAVTGTATGSGTDYTLANGTLTINAGDVNDNITIAGIVNDLLDEDNETVIVTLSNPVNATLGTNTVHTYTIIDNDATPTVAFNSTSSNGLESISSANLQVDLSAASGLNVTVDYTVSGTATGSGTDFTLANGTLTINAFDASGNITIAGIVNDLLDEENETVIVTLSNPTNATLGTNTVHTYTIIDNDATPTVAFNSTSSNGLESVSSANLQVDLSEVSGLTITVDYTVSGTATGSGTDYTLANGTLTINAGYANNDITIASIVNDILDENDETVIVTLTNPTNATLGTNTIHTYTITDNDATPTVAFNSTSSNGLESVSSADLQVDLSAVSGLDIYVDYAVTGTATGGGTDYTLANGTLTINALDASNNITIAGIVNDLLDEDNETVIVTLLNPINATLGTNTIYTYTITDDDDAPTVTTNPATSLVAKTVTLNGLVNANNAETTVTFEYGLTDSYGTSVAAVQSPVSGITNTYVHADITGLTPNTTYHYRVVGVNTVGTSNGSDLTFTTLSQDPIATTNAASDIEPTGAILNGTVNANDLSTTVTYEYGTTDSYGTTVTADESPVTGTTGTEVSASITGLSPNATYHFRVVGVNSAGTTNGDDLTFATTKYDQVITFNALTDKTTDDTDFDPGATSDLGLIIFYVSSNELVATIVSDQIHIVGAGTTEIMASQAGNDTVNVATPISQSLTVTEATGIENAYLANVKVYPNPASELLNIDVGNLTLSDNVKVSIVDISGKTVFCEKIKDSVYEIDVSDLSSGLYFVEINTSKGLKKLKLIIE